MVSMVDNYPVVPEIDDVVEFSNPQLASQGTMGIVTGMHPIGQLDLIIPEWETKQPGDPGNPWWPTSIEGARLVSPSWYW